MFFVSVVLFAIGLGCLVFFLGIQFFSSRSLGNPQAKFHDTWKKFSDDGDLKNLKFASLAFALFLIAVSVAAFFAAKGATISPSLGMILAICGLTFSFPVGLLLHLLNHQDDPRFSLILCRIRQMEETGSNIESVKRQTRIVFGVCVVLVILGTAMYLYAKG